MNIVVNRCFGGFGLSKEAMIAYAKLKGKTLYVEGQGLYKIFWTVPKSERPKEIPNWSSAPIEDRRKYNEEFKKLTLNDRNIPRDDKDLVSVVKKLGRKASDRFSDIQVITIPDDVDWEISEYDGLETVEEKHRSWP